MFDITPCFCITQEQISFLRSNLESINSIKDITNVGISNFAANKIMCLISEIFEENTSENIIPLENDDIEFDDIDFDILSLEAACEQEYESEDDDIHWTDQFF